MLYRNQGRTSEEKQGCFARGWGRSFQSVLLQYLLALVSFLAHVPVYGCLCLSYCHEGKGEPSCIRRGALDRDKDTAAAKAVGG